MKNWPKVALGELLKKSDKWIELDPTMQYKEVTVRLWGKGVVLRREVSGSEIASKKRLQVQAGQFILSRIDARNGAFGLIPQELDRAVVSSDFPVFEMNQEKMFPAFLGWLSRTHDFVGFCLKASEGTTNRVRLKEHKFLATEIPLPPLAEQQRIVAKIEQLAAKVEEVHSLKRHNHKSLRKLLASAKNDIFSDTKTKGCPVVELGEISEIRAGVTLGRRLSGPTIKLPYLRVANVQDGYLDLKHIKRVEIYESEKEKWQLQKGDILLTEGGDWDKLGRGTVWNEEILNCIHQNHIFRVRVNPKEIDPYYLSILVSSPYGKSYFQAASKQTTNLASINQRQLKAFPVYMLPLEKQRQIITYLEELKSKVDSLKRFQAQTQTELDALLPSILDKAFRGEL